MSFRQSKRVGWPPNAARLIGFREVHLFRRQTLGAMDSSPARDVMTAAQVLLVDRLMAASAVPCREMLADREHVMIRFFLHRRRLMAVKTVHAFFGVIGHLILAHHRVLEPGMAFRALSGGADEVGCGLIRLNPGACTIDKKCRKDQRKSADPC